MGVKSFWHIFLVALVAIGLFFSVYSPIEYYLTETRLLVDAVSPVVSSSIFVALIAMLSLIKWSAAIKYRLVQASVIVVVLIGVLLTLTYQYKKGSTTNLPKIYRISPDWGVQGQIVTIEGKNFFPVWDEGRVVVGSQEMVVETWDDKIITAEAPVPSSFGWRELYIIRTDGVVSNKVPYEVRDPATLDN